MPEAMCGEQQLEPELFVFQTSLFWVPAADGICAPFKKWKTLPKAAYSAVSGS